MRLNLGQMRRNRSGHKGKARAGRHDKREAAKGRNKPVPLLGGIEDWHHANKFASLKSIWTEEQLNKRYGHVRRCCA